MLKKYEIWTEDDAELCRAVSADGMARVLYEFDEELRGVVKWGDNDEDIDHAERWRGRLREMLLDEGVVLDKLWE